MKPFMNIPSFSSFFRSCCAATRRRETWLQVRQRDSLVLIASENFTSKSVYDALGSIMSNKYSEGYPGARYYGGNEQIDKVMEMCRGGDRVLPCRDRIDPRQGLLSLCRRWVGVPLYLGRPTTCTSTGCAYPALSRAAQ